MGRKPKKQAKHSVALLRSIKRTDEFLPSKKRTNEIIRDIEFMQIMKYIKEEKLELVEKWLQDFKPNLKKYLSLINAKKENIDINIHCRDLNYILDTISERVFEYKKIERIKWYHDIEETTIKLLNNEFKELKCKREMYDSNNNYMHIKKYMRDLCEDIKYIIEKKMKLQKNANCKDIIFRVSERQKQLREVFHTNTRHSVFNFDNNCTIDYIMNNFSGNECNNVAKSPKPKAQTVNTSMEQTKQDASPALGETLTTAPGQSVDTKEASEQEDDEMEPNGIEESDFLMGMSLKLSSGEAEPKLDTTYAAASLCGVSLIGAMIYKFKPFGFGSRAPGMRNGMGGYPLPDAANGDYFMDNFEYLQTGIPNNEYHLGYGPAADH
ncbi:PIR protein [Plasmodium vivax]|nr:PIR protein [Plasmodium vivax]